MGRYPSAELATRKTLPDVPPPPLAGVPSELLERRRDSDAFYYSFVTLTTLGYGDIVPVTRLAKSLSCLEALVGQIFLVAIVARLVGFLHVPDPRAGGRDWTKFGSRKGIPPGSRLGNARPAAVKPFAVHDLRRSCITNWAKKLPIQSVQHLAEQALRRHGSIISRFNNRTLRWRGKFSPN